MKKTKLVIQQAENGTYFTQVSKGVRPDGKRNRRMFTGSTEDEVYFKATKWLKGIEEEERNPYTVREAMLQFYEILIYRVQILIVLYSNAPYIAIANKNMSQSCLTMGMAAAGEWLRFTVS